MTTATIPIMPAAMAALPRKNQAEAYTNLGTTLKGQGKLPETADAYRRALALEPERPEHSFNLATTLHELGELDEAVDYYRLALRHRPAFPEASNNLATALKEQGRLDEAVSQFRATLAMRSDHVLPFYNLSELAAVGHYTFTSDELARVQRLLDSAQIPVLERSFCAFTLASVRAKQGAHEEAFGYYRQANQLRKGLLKAQGLAFDAKEHEALVDRISACHDPAYFAQVTDWGTDTDLPVFIIGMPRSGSTLVEQILASHPRVFGAGELGEVPSYIRRLVERTPRELYANPVLADAQAARAVAADYIERMGTLGGAAERVTIKTLDNFLHLGLITTLFPRARIIHCRRDPLDVCLSCYFQNFKDMRFAWSLEDIGAYYRSYEKLMAHWSKVLPTQPFEVCYEELVQNQEKITRDLLCYCGLEWDKRCLAFFATRRNVRTASAVQVRKPISTEAIGRWKHYRAHLEPLFAALRQPSRREAEALAPQYADSTVGEPVPHSYLG